VTQAAPYDENQFLRVLTTLKGVFKRTLPFHTYVRSFTEDWGFALGTDRENAGAHAPEEVDDWISTQVRGRNRYLNGSTYAANVSISPEALRRLRRRVRPITDAEARTKVGMTETMTPWVYQ
jgi:predicted membrane-bound spermidine synthase